MTEGDLDEGAWRTIHEDGLRAFPGVALGLRQLADHARRTGASDPQFTPHGRELFLACACARGDAHAIRALDRDYFPAARAALARFAARSDFVDEVLQELRGKLLLGPEPRIADYAARGPLVAWLRVAASRLAIDLLRAEGADRAAALEATAGGAGGRAPGAVVPMTEPMNEIDLGPEVQLLRALYRESFREALSATLGALSAEDRNLLRRHLVDRLTLQEIAVPYGVHTATIARRLTGLRERIAEAVRQALAVRHREEGGGTSLESLARAIRSQIDLSLSPLLSSPSRPVVQAPGAVVQDPMKENPEDPLEPGEPGSRGPPTPRRGGP